MSGHSSGPWTYEPGDMDDHYIMANGLLAVTEGLEPHAEDEANARLMAAAPELLEAAKAVRAWMDAAATRGAKTPMQAHELRVIVKNAIDQAEGRTS